MNFLNFFTICVVLKVLALFTSVRCRCALEISSSDVDPVLESKIINGERAVRGQFPHQAALKIDNKYFCGGSLISELWILTAAHCAYKVGEAEINLGALDLDAKEEGRVTIHCRVMIVHEKYNEYLNNDIALIKLPEQVSFTEYIKPVSLPRRSDVNKTLVNETVQVCGWGRVADENEYINRELHYINLTVIPNEECVKSYKPEIVIESTICANAEEVKTTCKGDSGGGLVRKTSEGYTYTHVGVVSFVSKKGCSSGAPSGYVRTSSFIDWISNITSIVMED